MNSRPLQSYVSVGIVHFMAYPECMGGDGPVLESLATIVEDPFFTAIELGPVNAAGVRREAAALLGSSGMKVGFGVQPMLLSGRHDLNSFDVSTRRAAMDVCMRGLDQAVELGAQTIAVLSGADVEASSRPAAVDLLVESLAEFGEQCSSAGLDLYLETFDRDIDKKCLVGPNVVGVDVSSRVRQLVPGFGLLVDLSHLPLQHETIDDGLRVARDHLRHVHVGNCVLDPSDPLYGDQHPRFGHPAGVNGVPELRAFLAALLDVGYLRPDRRAGLAFEVKPAPGESSATIIAQSKRTLLHAWSTVSVNEGA